MSELSRRVFLGTASLAAGVGAVASAAAENQQAHEGSKENSEELPTFRFAMEQNKGHVTDGGSARQATIKELPVSRGLAGVSMRLKPGGLRELHWHPNADEWQYYVTGKARMTVFGSDGRVRTEDFHQGDAGYVPRGYGHYIENVGDEPLRVLIGFNSGDYQEISLSTWLAANPDAIIADNFKVDDSLVAKLPKKRVFVASKDGPDA
jgi:oxalate decarboxylase